MTDEKLIEDAVKRWLKNAKHFDEKKIASQVPLKLENCVDCRFDVVAYDKDRGVFWIVECKPTSREVEISNAFGQAATYHSKIQRYPDQFVDSASEEKIIMRYRRWAEATDAGRRIRVELYVALKNEACKNLAAIRDFRKRYPEVGVIRYKEEGTCRDYLRDEKKEKDSALSKAETLTIMLNNPWSCPLGQNR